MFTSTDLQEFANKQGSGWLKHWKASSMFGTLSSIPAIFEDEDRLRKYVANCLEMEGFSKEGIDNIVLELIRNKKEFLS